MAGQVADRGAAPGLRRGIAMLALVVAGESIFFLPFVLARVFRPTLLDVFGLTNLELGTAFAAYGVVAMVAYFAGGPLADRFQPRLLIGTALVTTAAGGLLMAAIPNHGWLTALYAYWGFTTIALFWAALMRATREWGGEDAQGAAFGWLDGGRGLLTAVTGSLMVAIYASLLPRDVESADLAVRAEALRRVILILSAMGCGAALLVWFALPHRQRPEDRKERLSLHGVRRVVKLPAAWLQALIILCAYVGFKATDDFSLYAREVLHLDEVDAAKAGTVSLWVRPVAAVGAGFLADRFGSAVLTLWSFVFLTIGALVLAAGGIGAGMLGWFLVTITGASLGIFALRGLYFAIMREGRIPLSVTGSAVGFVSVVGYTPDVFMGPLMGVLLDGSDGARGHQHVFMVVTAFAALGLIAAIAFARFTRNR